MNLPFHTSTEAWDLVRALEMLKWAQSHAARNSDLQQRLQHASNDLAFCRSVLSNPEADSEFK